MKEWLQNFAIAVVDVWMSLYPRKRPPKTAIDQCKIIAHRGVHDNQTLVENTLPAFEAAAEIGIWGIETDIRWTSDLVPVIHHDPDTGRLFDRNLTIRDTPFQDLRDAIPQIPTLEELVDRFGGTLHLMLELKEEPFPQIEKQIDILRERLSALEPISDFHILSLDPALFETFDIRPRSSCLSVTLDKVEAISDETRRSGYGGLTGHYLLLNEHIRLKHQQVDQAIGTGFIRSRNCLFRELNRDVRWIFTNDAEKLQKIVNESKALMQG